MKKISIVCGLLAGLLTGSYPCLAMSLKFDLNLDGIIGDTSHVLMQNQLMKIDVWLDEYDPDDPDADLFAVSYDFIFDTALLVPWPDSERAVQPGELWDPPPFSGVSYDESRGLYEIDLGSFAGIDIPSAGKILLTTIVLRTIGGGEGYISTSGGSVSADRVYPSFDAAARISGPCEIALLPFPSAVFSWETVQFDTTSSGDCGLPCYTWEVSSLGCTGSTIEPGTGLYTAGEPLSGNTCNDTVQAIDPCNGDSMAAAEVTVTAVVPTTTTTTSILPNPVPPGPLPTTTTSVKSPGETCITDKSCNDLVFCNGEEFCNKTYSWSSDIAGATGNTAGRVGVCQRGEVPCTDDGKFCNGEEICDEDRMACLHSGDPCEQEGLACSEVDDQCIEACSEDSDCDDGTFCNGSEVCADGICQTGETPCLPEEICNEEDAICEVEDTSLSFTPFPQVVVRSRIFPLPLIIVIRSDDGKTTFQRGNTVVTLSGDDVLNPPWTLVLSAKLLYVFSLIRPAGFEETEPGREILLRVVTPGGNGTAILNVLTLPFI